MRIKFRYETESGMEPLAEIDLPAVPRIGDSIVLEPDEERFVDCKVTFVDWHISDEPYVVVGLTVASTDIPEFVEAMRYGRAAEADREAERQMMVT